MINAQLCVQWKMLAGSQARSNPGLSHWDDLSPASHYCHSSGLISRLLIGQTPTLQPSYWSSLTLPASHPHLQTQTIYPLQNVYHLTASMDQTQSLLIVDWYLTTITIFVQPKISPECLERTTPYLCCLQRHSLTATNRLKVRFSYA